MKATAPRTKFSMGIVCLPVLIGLTAWACGKSDAPAPGGTAASTIAAKPAPNFSGWIPYTSDEAGFSVLTPAVFAPNSETTPTDAGDIRFQRFTAQPDFHHIYIIVVSRMPEALVAGRNPVELLQGAREGVIGQFQGTVTSERQMILDGRPGLEIKVTGTSQGMSVTVVSRVYLARNSLYQAYVIAEKGYEDDASDRHFLDSFKLK